MGFACPKIVSLLIEHGANPRSVDVMGNNPLHYCAIRGNTLAYVQFLTSVKEFDPDMSNHRGITALGEAVFTGANKKDIVEAMVTKNRKTGNRASNTCFRTNMGYSVLMMAVENEDCDPEVVQVLHDRLTNGSYHNEAESMINAQARPKEPIHQKIFRNAVKKMKTSPESIDSTTEYVALHAGASAVHFAVIRGDLDLVRVLFRTWDCDLFLKNDLGLDTLDLCERGPYPKIRKLLKRYRAEQVVEDEKKAKEKKRMDFIIKRNKEIAERDRKAREKAQGCFRFL
jgi:ankyrin repeat protein